MPPSVDALFGMRPSEFSIIAHPHRMLARCLIVVIVSMFVEWIVEWQNRSTYVFDIIGQT